MGFNIYTDNKNIQMYNSKDKVFDPVPIELVYCDSNGMGSGLEWNEFWKRQKPFLLQSVRKTFHYERLGKYFFSDKESQNFVMEVCPLCFS